MEIFIEEAEEVLETLNEYLPAWREDNSNFEALTEVRRAFHTLKGSGRMVGATVVGELAWAVEDMLNRVLDNTIEASSTLFELLDEVIGALPVGVEAFKNSNQQSFETDEFTARANAPASGEAIAIAEELSVEEPSAIEEPSASEELPVDNEPEAEDERSVSEEPAAESDAIVELEVVEFDEPGSDAKVPVKEAAEGEALADALEDISDGESEFDLDFLELEEPAVEDLSEVEAPAAEVEAPAAEVEVEEPAAIDEEPAAEIQEFAPEIEEPSAKEEPFS